MSHHGAENPSGAPENLVYRVARLADHLAVGPLGELGVRVEARGEAVLLTGTGPSAQCRDDILRAARDELAGFPVYSDLLIADAASPDHAEELA